METMSLGSWLCILLALIVGVWVTARKASAGRKCTSGDSRSKSSLTEISCRNTETRLPSATVIKYHPGRALYRGRMERVVSSAPVTRTGDMTDQQGTDTVQTGN
jgi:hypothetical protein